MKKYRYFLDGTLLADDPIGWDNFKPKLQRIKEFNALLLTIDATFDFFGDGFSYLLNQINTSGHCGFIDLEVQELNDNQQTYRVVHKGNIRLSQCEIDRQQMKIKAPAEDNSFYARINNNKNIAAFPYVDRSKNDVTITACPFSYVHYTVPSDCSVNPIIIAAPFTYTSAHFRAFDLFTYLISFMTDGRVDFQSTLLDTGDYAGLMVTCGKVIRQITTGTTEISFKKDFQKISFQKLYAEVNKLKRLCMRVATISGRPTVIIEQASDLNQTNIMHTCSDIEKVTETIDVSQLYAILKLGSTKTENAASLSFPEDTTVLGFKEEELLLAGQCNLDSTLDLVNSFIISSNVTEDCLINGATAYDKDFFFVMTEPYYANWITKTGNIFGDPTPCQFNLDLTNDNKIQNWLSGIPSSLVQYLGTPVDARFRASDMIGVPPVAFTTTATYSPVGFNDDSTAPNFDTSNTYSIALSRFISPAAGTYNFHTRLFLQLRATLIFSGSNAQATASFRRFDVTNTLIEEKIIYDQAVLDAFTQNLTIDGTRYFFLNATDYVIVHLFLNNNLNPFGHTFTIPAGSFFECIATASSGGEYQSIDPNDALILNHAFKKDLTPDAFDSILADPRGLIEGTTHNNYRFQGWIDEISYERVKGEATFKLYSSRNT